MNEFPKVSIIVPICNVEKYLYQCLNSLISQTLKEIEIICVNDGSTDSSLSILLDVQKQDNRIIIIDKINTGYGDSVNKGIQAAKGKYIGIVESDDFASETMFELLYTTAEKYDADMVKGNYYSYYTKGTKAEFSEYLKPLPYDIILSEEERKQLIFAEPAIWCGLYKKSLLEKNAIFFLTTPGASYQDTGFAYKTAFSAEKIVLIKDAILYYRKDNINSSVKDNKKIFCICDEFVEIERFIRQRGLESELPVYMKAKYYRYIWNLNRLEREGYSKFLLKMHWEFKKASFLGLLEKKYWYDHEWEDIHKLIYNFTEYCKRSETESKKAYLNTHIDFFRCIKEVYVYGAGKRANVVINYLQSVGVNIKGIIVSDMKNNPCEINHVEVMDVNYVLDTYRNAFILICIAQPICTEIIRMLKESNSNNFLLINDELYQLILEDVESRVDL